MPFHMREKESWTTSPACPQKRECSIRSRRVSPDLSIMTYLWGFSAIDNTGIKGSVWRSMIWAPRSTWYKRTVTPSLCLKNKGTNMKHQINAFLLKSWPYSKAQTFTCQLVLKISLPSNLFCVNETGYPRRRHYWHGQILLESVSTFGSYARD